MACRLVPVVLRDHVFHLLLEEFLAVPLGFEVGFVGVAPPARCLDGDRTTGRVVA